MLSLSIGEFFKTLILAAAGLNISIPSFSFDVARSEEVQAIRDKLLDERKEYILAITQITNEAFDRLTAHAYRDTVDWALNEAILRIKPVAVKLEMALKKLDRPLLQRLSINFLSDGIPSIGSIMLEKGPKDAFVKSVEVLLKVLCTNLARSIEERKVPEVVYGYKFAKLLKAN